MPNDWQEISTFIEDCPRLARKTLVKADALRQGAITLWTWGAADVTIRVTAGRDEITLTGDGAEVRVVLRASCMICPSCNAAVRYVLRHSGWGCRHCRRVDYRIRHQIRMVPLLRRQRLLRRLAEGSVVGLREVELRRQLVEVEERIIARISNAHHRACARQRRAGH